jgi:flagellar biosynthesis protein FliR
MASQPLAAWVASCLLVGLRIAPVFAFAPPFSLVRMPATFRLLFGLGLAIALVASSPETTLLTDTSFTTLVPAGLREFGVGLVFVLAFQIAFAALYVAGRTIDIESGFGLATVIDPTNQGQLPLIGSLFAYIAGGAFFALDGHIELLKLFAASYQTIPIGAWTMPHGIERLSAFMGTMFLGALGVAGGTILALFLVDLCIAMLSRTLPQMNVLVLGFQVKSLVLFLALPLSFGVGGILIARMMTQTLQAIPRLL